MPPKTKKVIKVVRKLVPKPKPASPAVADPVASPAVADPVASPAVADPVASPAVADPVAAPAVADPVAAPAVADPVAAPSTTASADPVTTVPQVAAADPAAPEPVAAPAATPEPSVPAAAPATTPEPASAPEPAVAPEPASEKPATKKATRIVKKIVKKVIIKRVPKHPVAAKPAAAQSSSPPPAAATPKADKSKGEAAPTEGDEAALKADKAVAGEGDEGLSEGRKRRKTEIFVGGLDRSAKEEDVRKVFGRVGEIMEVRMMMDTKTGRNKGFAFVRYADAAQAKKAVTELAKVQVCGKRCGAAALEGNDTIFLGNIDKTWKKEDIAKLLEKNGIEKIDTLTLMVDPNNSELNRGFAFLELETNRDAQLAFKKLQEKNAFGKGRNVKISWTEPLNDPDEEEMQKVKSVYAEGVPSSWNEDNVREAFKKFGNIERVVLARNIQSSKRKDFAFVNYTTREAALSCIELFGKEKLTYKGSKVNVHVSLAKPVQKDKHSKGGLKPVNKDKITDKPKAVEYKKKVDTSLNKVKPLRDGHTTNYGARTSSTTSELLHVLREQASWKPEQIGYVRGPIVQDHTHAYPGGKRPFSALDDTHQSDLRGYPHSRLDSSLTSSSYTTLSNRVPGSSLSYQQNYGSGYGTGSTYLSSSLERGQGGPSYYGSNLYY